MTFLLKVRSFIKILLLDVLNAVNLLFQIPVRLIESVEMKDLYLMDINCKDARSFR